MVEGLQEKELVEQERRPASQDDERVTAKKGKTGGNLGTADQSVVLE